MTVIAKGHSYKNLASGREYLVVEVPYKRTLFNRLLRRNTKLVTVKVYPLHYRNGKTKQFPLGQVQRWALLDIPTHLQDKHRTNSYQACNRNNTELNKKLNKNGQSHYLR